MNSEKKNIVLITSGHLSSCPRLLKEAEALSAFYNIHIVYIESIEKIILQDEEIKSSNPQWKFHPVKWQPKRFSEWVKKYISAAIFKISANPTVYHSPASYMQIKLASEIPAVLYIAHHPSALPAAYFAAKNHKGKYAYDIEDAFPFIENGRYLENPNQVMFDLEKRYINEASGLTTASPFYNDVYRELYSIKEDAEIILNVFPLLNIDHVEYKDRKDLSRVSVYWCSQTIGLNRGIQDIIKAFNEDPSLLIEIHLRGEYANEVKEELLSLVQHEEIKRHIYFHSSVSVSELEQRNLEHDIGLVLERKTSLNRDLCLANKLFDYMRSQTMIIATETIAQKSILGEIPHHCILYKEKDISDLLNQLKKFVYDKERLENARKLSYKIASEKYNWGIEREKFLNYINRILS